MQKTLVLEKAKKVEPVIVNMTELTRFEEEERRQKKKKKEEGESKTKKAKVTKKATAKEGIQDQTR